MKNISSVCILMFLLLFSMVSCTETSVPMKETGGAGQPCYTDGTCDSGLSCVSNVCVSEGDQEIIDENETDSPDNVKPDTEEPDDKETTDDNISDGNCDTESIGKNCTLDNECGKCNICVKGKCAAGCTTDDDCKMYTGLKCNKKLYRCTNVYASLQACGETKCPTGCCYAEAGLTAMKCLTTPDASKCGLCANGEIYMPDESKCVAAVCSTTTDNCSALNSSEEKPECFECKSGEFICEEDTACSQGSSGVLVNAAQCTPAGQKCVAGISECCSGMPCVEGYCY